MATSLHKPFLGHINPFGGKCVHGADGAYLHKGSQVNPKCARCIEAGRDGSK